MAQIANLPAKVANNVCTHSHAYKGYSLNPLTGWWVAECGLPTLYAHTLICDLCSDFFVPKYQIKFQYAELGVACDECDPS